MSWLHLQPPVDGHLFDLVSGADFVIITSPLETIALWFEETFVTVATALPARAERKLHQSRWVHHCAVLQSCSFDSQANNL